MAWTWSAYPRDGFAFLQTYAGTCGSTFRVFQAENACGASKVSRRAAVAGLSGLAVFAATPELAAPPFLLIMAGVLLTLIDRRSADRANRSAAPALPHPAPFVPARDIHLASPLSPHHELRQLRAPNTNVKSRPAVADLMARVSHEIRTPLNAVIGFSDVMHAEMFGPVGHPRYREYVTHICDSGRALLKSAEDTLAITSLLAEREPDDPLPAVDLARAAHDAWGFFATEAAKRRIAFDISVPHGLEILGERRPLRQILINLFSEALDRADDGGAVELTARVDGDLAEIEIGVSGCCAQPEATEGSLALTFARALLELQGATLCEDDCPGDWRVQTVLSCSAQGDFFALANFERTAEAYVC